MYVPGRHYIFFYTKLHIFFIYPPVFICKNQNSVGKLSLEIAFSYKTVVLEFLPFSLTANITAELNFSLPFVFIVISFSSFKSKILLLGISKETGNPLCQNVLFNSFLILIYNTSEFSHLIGPIPEDFDPHL